jgi:hypothetical protein
MSPTSSELPAIPPISGLRRSVARNPGDRFAALCHQYRRAVRYLIE